jgi:hypothetical protein
VRPLRKQRGVSRGRSRERRVGVHYYKPRAFNPPVGLKGTDVTPASLARSFACNLMLRVGEKDDGDDAGGIQIHTPQIDSQGIGRLARGKYFFRAAETGAQAQGAVPMEFGCRAGCRPRLSRDVTRGCARLFG